MALSKQAPPLELLTIEDAANRQRCSTAHVKRQIARGELATVDIAPPGAARSRKRIRSDDLAAYIERRTRRAGTA